MVVGDLAPTFSNTYPEVLGPWVSEQDFRLLIGQVNDGLINAMNPWGASNWLDAVLGLATGWLWEDFGMTSAKKKVRHVEELIKDWNVQRQNEARNGEGDLVKVVELRRTAYMSVSFLPFISGVDHGMPPSCTLHLTYLNSLPTNKINQLLSKMLTRLKSSSTFKSPTLASHPPPNKPPQDPRPQDREPPRVKGADLLSWMHPLNELAIEKRHGVELSCA